MGFHRSSKMGFAAIGGNLGPFTLRVSQTCNPSLHITSLSSHLCFSTHPPQEKHKNLSYFNIHPSFPRKKTSNFNIHPFSHISLRKGFPPVLPPKKSTKKHRPTSIHPSIHTQPSMANLRSGTNGPRSSLKLATSRAWWTLRA